MEYVKVNLNVHKEYQKMSSTNQTKVLCDREISLKAKGKLNSYVPT